jgi:hypothetical protein
MTFSVSTFTIEVDGAPTAVFKARLQAEANEIGEGWAQHHRDDLSWKGSYGLELPRTVRVRMAKASEKAAYEAGNDSGELLQKGIKVVYLDEPKNKINF